MFDYSEVTEITRNLLIALGIEIQRDTNVLIDQDTKDQLTFENLFIKANIDLDKALYISEYDIKLDPLDPKCTKLIERLFGKFLDDQSSEDIGNIPEVLTYFFDVDESDPEIKKYKLIIKFENGSKWEGNWYINKIICYDEAIFSINGTFMDIDLRPFDIVYPKGE